MRSDILEFKVLGHPAPKGSKRLVGRVMLESSQHLPAWDMAVLQAATSAVREKQWECVDGPCSLYVEFYFSKPKAGRFNMPAVKPDLDKLIRAVGDSLTYARVIKDDSRFVVVFARKFYCDEEFPNPGAYISVTAVGGE